LSQRRDAQVGLYPAISLHADPICLDVIGLLRTRSGGPLNDAEYLTVGMGGSSLLIERIPSPARQEAAGRQRVPEANARAMWTEWRTSVY
jgi:hypothetical protein